MDRHLHRLIHPILAWEINSKKQQWMQFCSTAVSKQELADAHLPLHVLLLPLHQDRSTPNAAKHQLRSNASRVLTTHHKNTALTPGFPPKSGSLRGHCQSSGMGWGHVDSGGVGNRMAGSGTKWLLDSRVMQLHSAEGNIILFFLEEQVHGEMKWLTHKTKTSC